MGSVTQSVIFAKRFTKLTGPCAYTLHSNPVFQTKVLFCAHPGCTGSQNRASGSWSMCSPLHKGIDILENVCTHRVHRFENLCTRQQECAHRVQGAPLISKTVIQYPKQMVQMAFCDLSHTFHNQVTNVYRHVFVILLWGILKSPLFLNPSLVLI